MCYFLPLFLCLFVVVVAVLVVVVVDVASHRPFLSTENAKSARSWPLWHLRCGDQFFTTLEARETGHS